MSGNVTFLVEPDSPNGERIVQRFAYSAQELGHEVLLLEFRDLEKVSLPSPSQPMVFFGSLNMIRKIQALGLPHKPLVWCDWDVLSCHHYYAHYGKYMIQQEYGFYPFGELPRLQEYLYKTYGYKNKIFIRPTTNDKVFTGEVVGEPQFDYWLGIAKLYDPQPTLLCVVSKPTQIHTEYRFIVADGKVVTGSQYKIGGMFQSSDPYTPSLVNFVEEVASVWQPHPIFVMDVAITRDEKCYVMEIGPVNGAGLYKCDIKAIVKSMADIAKRYSNAPA